jgi:hypothetical protein
MDGVSSHSRHRGSALEGSNDQGKDSQGKAFSAFKKQEDGHAAGETF